MLGIWLVLRSHRRSASAWHDAVAGQLIVLGLASFWVSGTRTSDGPQTFMDFRDAFSGFYDSWIYTILFGSAVGSVVVLIGAVTSRSWFSWRRAGAVMIGCLAAAVIIGLLDESTSPI